MNSSPTSPPVLQFGLAPLTGSGFPVVQNEDFLLLLDQGSSGGSGTAAYLQTMLQFSNFTNYLSQAGAEAFTENDGPNGSKEASATDGTTTMTVNVGLTESDGSDGQPAIWGMATITLALPDSEDIVKIAQFAVFLAEIPATLIVTQQLWAALFSPLLNRLCSWVRTTMEAWSEIDGEEAADDIGGAIADSAGETAEGASAEAADVVVEEEVVASLAIDVTAAVPAFAVLGLLVAVPIIILALAKNFTLYLEIDNLTDTPFTWSAPYTSEGAITAQPSEQVIPAMGMAVDSWGDVTTQPVVYQANFTAMNSSGYSGIGLLINLSPPGGGGDDDITALISIPWLTDNAIWLGTPGSSSPDWAALYDANSGSNGQIKVTYGTRDVSTSLSIDALSGNQDQYHAILRIESL